MGFLSLATLLELFVVSLPAHVSPVAALPGSHALTLSRACPEDVPQQFPGTQTALPWKVSMPEAGTALLPCRAWRGALCHAWSVSAPLPTWITCLSHAVVLGSRFALQGPRGLQQGPAPAP